MFLLVHICFKPAWSIPLSYTTPFPSAFYLYSTAFLLEYIHESDVLKLIIFISLSLFYENSTTKFPQNYQNISKIS